MERNLAEMHPSYFGWLPRTLVAAINVKNPTPRL
jgi:hypothetical protein